MAIQYKYWKVEDAAARLRVSTSTIYRMMRCKRIRSLKVGGRLRVLADDLEALARGAK